MHFPWVVVKGIRGKPPGIKRFGAWLCISVPVSWRRHPGALGWGLGVWPDWTSPVTDISLHQVLCSSLSGRDGWLLRKLTSLFLLIQMPTEQRRFWLSARTGPWTEKHLDFALLRVLLRTYSPEPSEGRERRHCHLSAGTMTKMRTGFPAVSRWRLHTSDRKVPQAPHAPVTHSTV